MEDKKVQVQKSAPEEPKVNKKFHIDWILSGILVIALFLYGWKIWEAGSANDFYTSAIKSMTMSWSNFWYGSFDPAGYITVDKPPVALWFMAISAKIFGVHGWSVVLPSVLFGVGSVYLMYRLTTPYFGKTVGRISALAMTLTPIVVADSRTNNMDATLVFFLLLAIYFLEKSIDKGKIRWLIISFALVGIAFNVKMLQAFMILPAMYLFYWIASKKSWKQKLRNLSFGTIALAVFTLFWPMAVDSTSASKRPYIGGSEHNSVMELAFGYNGTERLLGQTTGTGGTFPGMNSKSKKTTGTQNKGMGMPTGGMNGTKRGTPPTGMKGGTPPTGMKGGPGGNMKGKGGNRGGAGGAGGAFNVGTAGPFRLFQTELGPQISWYLPFALIGAVGGLALYNDRKKKWYQLTTKQKQIVLWSSWLVPVYGFFSVASFFHPYYTIMLAPPIAALFGIGVQALITCFKKNNLRNWKTYLLPLAITSTAGLQSWYVYSYYPWLTAIILGAGVVISILLLTFKTKRRTPLLVSIGIGLLLIAPTWWSLTPTISGQSAAIPTAGPSLLSSGGNHSGGIGNGTVNTKLLNYLEKNQGNAKYLFATTDSGTAAPYIIKTGKAVMAMGGFNGTDPAMTLKEFKELVKKGEIKYFYSSQRSGNTAIINWIKKNAKTVSTSLYEDSSSTKSSNGMNSSNKQMPNGNSSKNSSSKQSSNKNSFGGQGGPGGMMGQSGTLYDLTSIYK